MANIAHEPTDERKAMVENLALVGVTQEKIAGILNIDLKTLRKHYREILDYCRDNRNAQLCGRAYKLAMEGNDKLIMFLLKTQAGFREKQEIDHTSKDGSMTPSVQVVISPGDEDEFDEKYKGMY